MPFIVGGFAVQNKPTQAGTEELRLAKDQIYNPTAAYVLAYRATMFKDVSVSAAGFFQGVGQERQAVEGAVVVDHLGQSGDSTVVPPEPRRQNKDNLKRVAVNIAEEIAMRDRLHQSMGLSPSLPLSTDHHQPTLTYFKSSFLDIRPCHMPRESAAHRVERIDPFSIGGFSFRILFREIHEFLDARNKDPIPP
jgi:hypothetical protein